VFFFELRLDQENKNEEQAYLNFINVRIIEHCSEEDHSHSVDMQNLRPRDVGYFLNIPVLLETKPGSESSNFFITILCFSLNLAKFVCLFIVCIHILTCACIFMLVYLRQFLCN
jgi:hypothetical protein